MNSAAAKKCRKYSDIEARGHQFDLLAFETLGQPSTSSENFICKLGAAIQASNGDPRSATFLRQRLSVAIQQHNAACVLGSLPENAVPPF